jgi:hypothetical protein
MLSEIVLGTVIPLILIYKSSLIQNSITLCEGICNLYMDCLQTTREDYKDNIVAQICSPWIALFVLTKRSILFARSMYIYSQDSNVTHFDEGISVQYTLHGKEYSILIPNKNKTEDVTLLEAYGIVRHSEDDKVLPESDEVVPERDEKYDIMSYMCSIIGPDRDFHSQTLTPSILGYDKVFIRYVDGQLDEKEKLFQKDDVFLLN